MSLACSVVRPIVSPVVRNLTGVALDAIIAVLVDLKAN